MRILYGLNSQGQGHLSKAAVLVPLLERRGHEVRVVSSGPTPPACYQFPGHRHFSGLEYAVTRGGTDYARTAWNWAARAGEVVRDVRSVQRVVAEFEPQLIWSDFEPLTASPLLRPTCEVWSVCRQAALLDKGIPLPPVAHFDQKLARSAFRLFVGGADRKLGYHYQPETFRCLPPIVREELSQTRVATGAHFVVYAGHHTTQKDPHELVQWAWRHKVEVRAYGFSDWVTPTRSGTVDFRAPHRARFFEDLATSRGVLTTAGLTTPVEAALLGKPVVVVPIANQWEQLANAYHLEQAGLAVWSRTWSYDPLLTAPPPAAIHPLRAWLAHTPEQVLDMLLPAAGASKPPHRAAA